MTERYASPILSNLPMVRLISTPLGASGNAVYLPLWRAIVSGKLKPGTPLGERALSETLQAEPALVQTVLAAMEKDGILERRNNRSWNVALPNPDEVGRVVEACLVVVSHVIRQLACADTLPATEVADLVGLHTRAQIAADSAGDAVTSRLLAIEFTILLAAIHGNPILTSLLSRAMRRLLLAQSLYGDAPQQFDQASFQRNILTDVLVHKPFDAIARYEALFQSVVDGLGFDAKGDACDLAAALSYEATV
jgi:DNA-binding GntR family transcriptional regulator